MIEAEILARTWVALARLRSTLFRQNTGVAWQGAVERISPTTIMIHNPRPVHFGLCKGSSDLIGWTRKTITAEDVGKTVAVFTAIELKTRTGRATADQENFIRQVTEAGGIAGVARSPDEGEQLVEKWGPR